jgi:hypothetical protein
MDSQSGILADIISNAIKSAFSEFARQHKYKQSYYQQPITSANIASSYSPIQQQSYEESACLYPRALNYATTSMSTTDESAHSDYSISPCSHQDNLYQPMTVPQTAQLITTTTSGSSVLLIHATVVGMGGFVQHSWTYACCETWVPLGPHRPGSRPSPDKWVRPTRRPADLSVGPTDLVGGPHDLLKAFQKIPHTT